MKYIDITNQYTTKKHYQLRKQKYFIDADGTEYRVDGHYVILKPTLREIEVAHLIGKMLGGQVNIIPRINEPSGIKTPDYIVNDEKFDLKEILGNGKNTLEDAIKKKEKQSGNFIFDITKTKMTTEKAICQIEKIYLSPYRKWVNKIILIKNDEILNVFSRDN